MAYRITSKQLIAQADIINRMLGLDSHTIGSIQISGAYGGWGVHRLANEYGGVSDLLGGHFPARETHRFLSGMIAALRIVNDKG